MTSTSNQILQPSPIRPIGAGRCTKPILERFTTPPAQRTSVPSSPHSTNTISLRSTPDTLVDPIERTRSRLAKLEDLIYSTDNKIYAAASQDCLATHIAPASFIPSEGPLNYNPNDFGFQGLGGSPPPIWTIPDQDEALQPSSLLLKLIKEEDSINWNEVFDPEVHLVEPRLNPTASAFVPGERQRTSLAVPTGSRRGSAVLPNSSVMPSINVDISPKPNPDMSVDWSWVLNTDFSLSGGSPHSSQMTETSGNVEKDRARRAFYLGTKDLDIDASSQTGISTKRREIPLFPPGLQPPALLRHVSWPAQDIEQFPRPFVDVSSQQFYHPPLYLPLLEAYMDPAHPLPLRSGVAQNIVDAMNYSCQFVISRQDVHALVQDLVTASTRLSIRAQEIVGPDIIPSAVDLDNASSRQQAVASKLSDGFGELASLILAAVVRTLGDEAAVDFGWRLCDALVHEFHRRWMASGVDSIQGQDGELLLPVFDVCRSIGALRKYGILPQEHVQICFETLLDNLSTPEHVDALGFMIGGMGVTAFIPREWDKLVERIPLPGSVDWEMMAGMYDNACTKMGWVVDWLLVQSGKADRPNGPHDQVDSRVMEIYRMVSSFEQYFRSNLDVIERHHGVFNGL